MTRVLIAALLTSLLALGCSKASGYPQAQGERIGGSPPIGSQCWVALLPEAAPLGAFTPKPRGELMSVSEDWVCLRGPEGEIWIPQGNIGLLVVESSLASPSDSE